MRLGSGLWVTAATAAAHHVDQEQPRASERELADDADVAVLFDDILRLVHEKEGVWH